MLLIQWISITLALASGESAVFLNQGLLRGIAVGLGRCVVRRSKVKNILVMQLGSSVYRHRIEQGLLLK